METQGKVGAGASWVGRPGPFVCSDTSVRGSAATSGDDRLIQTYSNAGNPDGSVRTRALSVVYIIHPLCVWPVGLSHSLKAEPVIKSEKTGGRRLSEPFQNVNSTILPPSASSCTVVRTSVPAHRLSLLKQVCFVIPTHVPDIVGLKDSSSPAFSSRSPFREFIMTSKLFSHSTVCDVMLGTTRVGTSGISLRQRDYMPICRNNYI